MTEARWRSCKARRATLRLLAAGIAAGIVVLLPVGLASSASRAMAPAGVTFRGGCKGLGTAHRSNGNVLDMASAPMAPGATTSDPFKVAQGGTVDWSGSTPVVFTDHHWFLHVDGFPLRSGGSLNASHEKSAAGVVKVDSYLPSWLGLTGTYYVNGQISGVGGTCTGAVYVEVIGDAATGLLLWVGIVFALGGLVLLFGSRPSSLTVLRTVPKATPATTPFVTTTTRVTSATGGTTGGGGT